jgi:hypothetical protein
MGKPFNYRKNAAGGTEENFRAQSNIESAFTALGSSIITNGSYLENITLGTTATSLAHKLGRPYRGYIVCKSSAAAKVYNAPDTDTGKFINLLSDVATTVSIWVF